MNSTQKLGNNFKTLPEGSFRFALERAFAYARLTCCVARPLPKGICDLVHFGWQQFVQLLPQCCTVVSCSLSLKPFPATAVAVAAATNSIYFAFVCFAQALLCFLFTYLSQYAINTTSHVVCGIYTRTHARVRAADASTCCTHTARDTNRNRFASVWH